MGVVVEMLPLPVNRQYGNSYRGTSSQSAVLVELAKRLQNVIAVF